MHSIKNTKDIKVEISVSPLDVKYTKTHYIRLTSQMQDRYNKKWVDCRVFRMMLTPDEMRELGEELIRRVGK